MTQRAAGLNPSRQTRNANLAGGAVTEVGRQLGVPLAVVMLSMTPPEVAALFPAEPQPLRSPRPAAASEEEGLRAAGVLLGEATEEEWQVVGPYAVEWIADERWGAGIAGGWEYLVKWAGFGADANTWEPESNILDETLVDEFRARRSDLEAMMSGEGGSGVLSDDGEAAAGAVLCDTPAAASEAQVVEPPRTRASVAKRALDQPAAEAEGPPEPRLAPHATKRACGDRQRITVLKAIAQVEALKARQARGEGLELSQVEKIGRETDLRERLATLDALERGGGGMGGAAMQTDPPSVGAAEGSGGSGSGVSPTLQRLGSGGQCGSRWQRWAAQADALVADRQAGCLSPCRRRWDGGGEAAERRRNGAAGCGSHSSCRVPQHAQRWRGCRGRPPYPTGPDASGADGLAPPRRRQDL